MAVVRSTLLLCLHLCNCRNCPQPSAAVPNHSDDGESVSAYVLTNMICKLKRISTSLMFIRCCQVVWQVHPAEYTFFQNESLHQIWSLFLVTRILKTLEMF